MAASPLACGHCGASFVSRNKLFRHLRCCEASAAAGVVLRPQEPKERAVVLFLGYLRPPRPESDVPADSVDSLVCHALTAANGAAPTSWARSSSFSDGDTVLRQAASTHALCDCASYNTAPGDGDDAAWLERVNAALPPSVRVFGRLQPRRDFHAHHACERRTYAYLLPLAAFGDAFASAALTRAELDATVEQFGVGNHHWLNNQRGAADRAHPLMELLQRKLFHEAAFQITCVSSRLQNSFHKLVPTFLHKRS